MKTYQKSADAIVKLDAEQYRVTQESGTERPDTGKYLHNQEPGIYVDVVSGEPLFASSDKFESGCGWPSFTKPIEPAHVNELRDTSHGMIRTECAAPMVTATWDTCFPMDPRIAEACGIASIRHHFDSYIATTWQRKVTAITSTRWRVLEWHKNAQCLPAVASGVCRT